MDCGASFRRLPWEAAARRIGIRQGHVRPTRSGKCVGLVIPTLLSWRGSAVKHDIKGENWQLTAGWRARFSNCLLFNPTAVGSAAGFCLKGSEVRRELRLTLHFMRAIEKGELLVFGNRERVRSNYA